MRRLMLAVAVSAVFGLAVAAPALGNTERNPWAFPLTVTCGSDTWDVITTGKVGFSVAGPEGKIGIGFGGHHLIYLGDELISDVTLASPAGLAGKVEACQAERSFEPNGLSVWDPIYILWPAQ